MGKGKWLTGANISVAVDDTFMEIVDNVDKIVKREMPDQLVTDEEFEQIWSEIGHIIEVSELENNYAYGVSKKKTYRTEIENERFNKIWRSVLENSQELDEVQKEVYSIWMTIVESAWKSAEPGIIWLERYNKLSNSWYFHRIVATNPLTLNCADLKVC